MAKLFANRGGPDQSMQHLICVCTVCQLPFLGLQTEKSSFVAIFDCLSVLLLENISVYILAIQTSLLASSSLIKRYKVFIKEFIYMAIQNTALSKF